MILSRILNYILHVISGFTIAAPEVEEYKVEEEVEYVRVVPQHILILLMIPVVAFLVWRFKRKDLVKIRAWKSIKGYIEEGEVKTKNVKGLSIDLDELLKCKDVREALTLAFNILHKIALHVLNVEESKTHREIAKAYKKFNVESEAWSIVREYEILRFGKHPPRITVSEIFNVMKDLTSRLRVEKP